MKTSTAIKILLVDDHAIFRKVTRIALNDFDDIDIVGECSDGCQVCDFLDENDVDVILMDITMKDIDGIQATQLARQRHPNTKVVAFTSHSGQRFKDAMYVAGASAYLDKGASPQTIKETATAVVNGDNVQKRDRMLAYIRVHIPFHKYTNMTIHTDEQLQTIIDEHSKEMNDNK